MSAPKTHGLSLVDRIHALSTVTASGCWEWTCHLDSRGYGRINVPGAPGQLAHRVSYEAHVGPIPDGLTLDHVAARGCTSKACVNPEHLEPVTNAENMRRRYADMTHCGEGHEFTDENTYMTPAGSRRCKRCQNAACARYRANRKAVA